MIPSLSVCRETELHPLVRWQFRGLSEEQRKAFLFERVASVTGHKYKMLVSYGNKRGYLSLNLSFCGTAVS